MKLIARVCAIAAALLMPCEAFAQMQVVECDQYYQLVESAPTGFLEYRRAKVREGLHRAYVPLLGECAIVENVDLQLVCTGSPLGRSAAERKLASQLKDLQRCFSGWSVAPPVPADGPGTILEGHRFIRYHKEGSAIVGVLFTELSEQSDQQFRLVFGVVFKPEHRAGIG